MANQTVACQQENSKWIYIVSCWRETRKEEKQYNYRKCWIVSNIKYIKIRSIISCCMFNFIRKWQIILCSDLMIVKSHPPGRMRVPIVPSSFPAFSIATHFTLAVLVGTLWYLIVVLIYIFPIKTMLTIFPHIYDY